MGRSKNKVRGKGRRICGQTFDNSYSWSGNALNGCLGEITSGYLMKRHPFAFVLTLYRLLRSHFFPTPPLVRLPQGQSKSGCCRGFILHWIRIHENNLGTNHQPPSARVEILQVVCAWTDKYWSCPRSNFEE